MKLTGAYGGINLNIKREENLKKFEKLDKSGKNLGGVKADISGVNKFEALTAQTLEQSKFYQTRISTLQNSKENLGNLIAYLQEGEENNFRDIQKEVERVILEANYEQDENLRNITVETLGLVGEASGVEVEEAIRQALLKLKSKEEELDEKIISDGEEIMKIKLASENIKAAISQLEDNESLAKTLDIVKDAIENSGLNVQNRASQVRVMNLLNN